MKVTEATSVTNDPFMSFASVSKNVTDVTEQPTIPTPKRASFNPSAAQELFEKLENNQKLTETELLRCLMACFVAQKETFEKQGILDSEEINISLELKKEFEKEVLSLWQQISERQQANDVLSWISRIFTPLLFILSAGAISGASLSQGMQAGLAVATGLAGVASGGAQTAEAIINIDLGIIKSTQETLSEKIKTMHSNNVRANQSLKRSLEAVTTIIETMLEVITNHQETLKRIQR